MTQEQAQKIKVGMTKQEVISLIGEPSQVNTTRSEEGTKEQWVYATADQVAGLSNKGVYIYFKGNTVSGVQY